MRYAMITLIAIALLVGEGCNKHSDAENNTPPCEDIEVDDASPARPDLSGEITPFDEAKCLASAKKWVKEAEGLLEDALKAQVSATDKAQSLHSLMGLQSMTGDRETAMKNFDRALDLIPKAVRSEDTDNALNGLALSARVAGFDDRAAKAEEMAKTYNKYSRFTRILAECAAKKDFAPAKKAAREIGGDRYRSIALAQAKAGLWDDAKETADSLVGLNPHLAISTFCGIAKYEVEAGNKVAAQKSFARAREILEASESIDVKDYRYASIAQAEAEVGLIEDAEKDLRNVRSGYHKYPALIILAESKYKAGDKKAAAEYLKQAKEDAQDRNDVQGLCSVAVAESKVIGPDEAWKTIRDAQKIQADIVEKSRGLEGPWMFSMESRSILRAMFEAGFRKHALTEAESQKIDSGHRACAMSEIALLYAQKGDFARAHVVINRMRKHGILTNGMGFNCHAFLNKITGMEVRAGVTHYVPELVADMEKMSNPECDDSEIGQLLARTGYENHLQKKYASIKDASADKRFNYCLNAAQGFLMRINDAKSR